MTKKLTVSEAEKFAKKMFNKCKDPLDKEFYVLHSRMVAETALVLIPKNNKDTIDKNILQIAGWLHDIGSVIDREDHAIHSIELLEKEGFVVSEKLKDCILNHGRSKSPKTREGKIIQLADKASVLRPELLRLFVESNSKDRKEIIDFFEKTTSRAIILLRNYR
jgi:HD superfamily phosphodiesterase